MFGLSVVLLLHFEEFLDGAVEGLAEEVFEALVGGLLLGVDASQELEDAERADEVVALLVIEEVVALALGTHPRPLADEQVD